VSFSVLIMARAPRPGESRVALEPQLGPRRCAELQATLILAAARWGTALGGSVHMAHSPADAGAELRALLPEGTTLFPQSGEGIAGRLADASARVFARSGDPLLVVWPDLPALRPGHAAAALADLEDGCDVVLGPVVDGGFYLVGLARPLQNLFSVPEGAWRDTDAMRLAFEAAHQAGLELGLLRVERALRQPADVDAALADPCLEPELARILGR
jgi:glycosyltransferase A (GT-A) superfamily protein (DUF2064 family)